MGSRNTATGTVAGAVAGFVAGAASGVVASADAVAVNRAGSFPELLGPREGGAIGVTSKGVISEGIAGEEPIKAGRKG
jgi:hypothetical protein